MIPLVPSPHLHSIITSLSFPHFDSNIINAGFSWLVFVLGGSGKSQLFTLFIEENKHASSWNDWVIFWEIKLWKATLYLEFVCYIGTLFDPRSSRLSKIISTSTFIKVSWAQYLCNLTLRKFLDGHVPTLRDLIISNSKLFWALTSSFPSRIVDLGWVFSINVGLPADCGPVVEFASFTISLSKSLNSHFGEVIRGDTSLIGFSVPGWFESKFW